MRARKIEEAYKKLQAEHGGLDGTQDTGYDDAAMDAYLKKDAIALQIDNEEITHQQVNTLLKEHR